MPFCGLKKGYPGTLLWSILFQFTQHQPPAPIQIIPRADLRAPPPTNALNYEKQETSQEMWAKGFFNIIG